MDDINALIAQRDGLARYIFERNGGGLCAKYCSREMEAGRCPYHDRPTDTERTVGVCVPCIVKLIGERTSAPPAPYFSLLAEYHMLVLYILIGGKMGTGRVQSLKKETIVINEKGKCKCYRLEKIDVIVPREVLRWSRDGLAPVAWRADPDGPEREQPRTPQKDIRTCLMSIGIQPLMEGVAELEIAVRLVLNDPALLEHLKDRLYPAVAEESKLKAGTAASHIHKLISTARRYSRDTGEYLAFYSTLNGRGVNVRQFLRAFLRYMYQGDIQPL